jgi:hypothetical protein
MTILDATIKENAAILAAELAANKTVTIGSLNGTGNAWDILVQPTPEMVIATVGTPPGGHWETTTIRNAQTIERDQGEGGYNDLVTMGPVVNINWVADPVIPSQPYTPAIPMTEIAAMTSSNTDEAILPHAAGYTVVGVPIIKKTISFKTTETISHKVTKISYMRKRLIEFVIDGLRPYARHYISFDDVRIDAYATTIDHPYTFGNKLVADASGKLVGLIRIPPNTFKCGEHVITISDANLPGDSEISIAEAIYIAKGLLDTSSRVYKTTKTVTMRASIDYSYVKNPPYVYEGGNC